VLAGAPRCHARVAAIVPASAKIHDMEEPVREHVVLDPLTVADKQQPSLVSI
jgi:hypothetical protein